MASDYGVNFGFRRSEGRIAEGRLKVPASGTFRLGSLVAFDAAAPGYLKAATSNQIGAGGYVGLLVQEEVWDRSIYTPEEIDSYYLGVARNNRLAVITSGPGTKVWFKNTLSQTRADGRVISAVTMIDFSTPPGVGDYLAWNGTNFIKGTGITDSILRVTSTNGTDYAEAVMVA